jgi:hypothetical protein
MYAVIEGGIVVGLSETDLTTYTALEVVPCDETVAVGDFWDGFFFTEGDPPPDPPPTNEELDTRLSALEASIDGGTF